MRIRPVLVIGVLLVVLGIGLLLHPQFSRRTDQSAAQIGGMKVQFETRKIVRVPIWLSGCVLAAGAIFVFAGWRRS